MLKITVVTGNPGKVRDLQAIAKDKLVLTMHDIEIDEIQSLDLEEIIKDKARKAYAQIKAPVIVEDVSAGLDSLNGLPGPFIKFFENELGKAALYQLAKSDQDRVKVSSIFAYHDGKQFILGKGEIKGKIVSPRGDNGFGFDSVIIPDGETVTMAEMTQEEKVQINHRGKAFKALLEQLEKLE